ncbi:hypothetical protein [Streptomyces prunicolor]|uniref:hypothetical protein n=1 Tax=Streptomyces prunicolor TaxID=67348 RepID=UPI0003AB24FE|nr:hypothetical protein [Streptomyces prunicolor]
MRQAAHSSRSRRPGRRAAIVLNVVAALALAGCGTAGTDSALATSSPGPTGEDRYALPSASGMASIASFVNRHTACREFTSGQKYDASGRNTAWGRAEVRDPSWGIAERAVCEDTFADAIALLAVPNMKTFEAAVREKDGHADFLVGRDFAVVPVNDRTFRDLTGSGLKFLTCDPNFSVPSGFSTRPALAHGCVLSNYAPAG